MQIHVRLSLLLHSEPPVGPLRWHKERWVCCIWFDIIPVLAAGYEEVPGVGPAAGQEEQDISEVNMEENSCVCNPMIRGTGIGVHF